MICTFEATYFELQVVVIHEKILATCIHMQHNCINRWFFCTLRHSQGTTSWLLVLSLCNLQHQGMKWHKSNKSHTFRVVFSELCILCFLVSVLVVVFAWDLTFAFYCRLIGIYVASWISVISYKCTHYNKQFQCHRSCTRKLYHYSFCK